jgi:hypothetical protein
MLVDGGSFTSIVLMFSYRLGGSFDCLHMTSFPKRCFADAHCSLDAAYSRRLLIMLLTHV